MSHSLINGCSADTIPIDDRGLAYGDGLFETLLLEEGVLRFRRRHLQRLRRGAERLALSIDLAVINRDLDQIVAQAGSGSYCVKLLVTRGSSARGYAIDPQAPVRRIVTLADVPQYPAAYYQQGVSLALCRTPLAIAPHLAGIKHLNRLEQVLARAELSATEQEGVLLDSEGYVVEGVFSNLFLVVGDELLTPRLDRCGVAGITREVIMEQARQAGVKVTERRLMLAELMTADALFMTGSLIQAWPVRCFNGRSFDSVGWADRARGWLQRAAEP